MSYILDALRKAERKRQGAGRAPTLETVHALPPRVLRRWWPWAVVGVFVLNAVALIVLLRPSAPVARRPAAESGVHSGSARPATQTESMTGPTAGSALAGRASGLPRPAGPAVTGSLPRPVVPPRGALAEPPVVVAQAAPDSGSSGDASGAVGPGDEPAAPSPEPVGAEPTDSKLPAEPPVDEPTASPGPLGGESTDPEAAAETAVDEPTASSEAAAPAPEVSGIEGPTEPVDDPGTASGQEGRAETEAPPPQGLEEASSSLRDAMTKMTLDVLVYSELEAERFVFISGQKYIEGERIDGRFVLEAITEEGAILSHEGDRQILRPRSNPYRRRGPARSGG